MDLMSYDDANLTILHQFRKRVNDVITPDHTDAVLLKWLRAKSFNLDEAEENFRGNLRSRNLYGVDRILDWYVKPEVIEKYEATAFLGFAKDGSGVRYMKMDMDYYGFMHSASSSDLNLYFSYMIENDLRVIREENNKTGRKSNQIVYIFDAEKFPFYQFTYKCVVEAGIESMRLLQDHFPEVWKYAIFINVTPIFTKFYNIFKPFLRESLARKIKVATKENTKELLRKYIDDDVLPAFLGGERVDTAGDPNCNEFIKQGGNIPEKYYLKNCLHFIDVTDPGVNTTIVNARRVFNQSFVIKETGTRMRYEMRTENGSIDFSVLFRDFGENPEEAKLPAVNEYLDPHDEKSNVEVVGVRVRLQCHFSPCNAIGTASKPGIYIVQFGNASSWFTSRKLFYRITLLPPENFSK